MPTQPKRAFKVGEEIYDIDEKDVKDFLSKAKDAVEVVSYQVGDEIYDIELKDIDDFLSKAKDAKHIGGVQPQKKKFGEDFMASQRGWGISTQPTEEQEEKKPTPTKNQSTSVSGASSSTSPKKKAPDFSKFNEQINVAPPSDNTVTRVEEQQTQEQITNEAIDLNTKRIYGKREDGTDKQSGFFGAVKTIDGDVMTENTISVNIDGEEKSIPTMIPTLTKEEIDYQRKGGDLLDSKNEIAQSIVKKATDWAIERQKQGRSAFADEADFNQQAKRLKEFNAKYGTEYTSLEELSGLGEYDHTKETPLYIPPKELTLQQRERFKSGEITMPKNDEERVANIMTANENINKRIEQMAADLEAQEAELNAISQDPRLQTDANAQQIFKGMVEKAQETRRAIIQEIGKRDYLENYARNLVVANTNGFDRAMNALSSGVSDLASSLYKAPAFAYDMVVGNALNGVSELVGSDMKAIPAREMAGFKQLQEVGEYLDKRNNARNYANSLILPNSASEYIDKGDYVNAAAKLTNDILQSAPITATYMAGGMLKGIDPKRLQAIMTMTFGTSNAEELREKGVDETTANLYGFLSGLMENTFERFGSNALMEGWKDVLEKGGKEELAEGIKTGFKPFVKNLLLKIMPAGAVVTEGVDEGATQVSQNILNYIAEVGEDKFMQELQSEAGRMHIMSKAKEGVLDAVLAGVGMGGTMAGGMYATKKTLDFIDKKEIKKAQDLRDRIDQLNQVVQDPSVSDFTKAEASADAQDANAELQNLVDANEEAFKELPEELKDRATELVKIKTNAEQELTKEGLTELSKSYLQEKADKAQNDIDEIIKEAASKKAEVVETPTEITEKVEITETPQEVTETTLKETSPDQLTEGNTDEKRKRQEEGMLINEAGVEETAPAIPIEETEVGIEVQEKPLSNSVKSTIKDKEFKPKKRRESAINAMELVEPNDFIAMKLSRTRLDKASFERIMGKAHVNEDTRLKYLNVKKGEPINSIAADLKRQGGVFENIDEKDIEQMIADFIIKHPRGTQQYAIEKRDSEVAIMDRYNEEAAYAEELAKNLEETERTAYLEETAASFEEIENDIDTLSDEDIDNLYNLFNDEQQNDTTKESRTENRNEEKSGTGTIEEAPKESNADKDAKQNLDNKKDLAKEQDNVIIADSKTSNGYARQETIRGNKSQEESDIRNEEIANELQTRVRKAYEDAGYSETDGKTVDLREIDNKVAYDYAKETDTWIGDFDNLGSPFIGGNENRTVVNEGKQKIYKSNNLSNVGSLYNFFDKIKLHNELFPETKYKFEGFAGLEMGDDRMYVEPVYSQDFIKDAENATPKEISDYMLSNGFEKVEAFRYKKGDIEVWDVRPRNVLKDANGDFYIIDAEFKQTKNSISDKALKFLDDLKIDTDNSLHAFGLSASIWNATIDTFKAAIKAGKAIHDAIEDAIKYAKIKQSQFDETGVRNRFLNWFNAQNTTPNNQTQTSQFQNVQPTVSQQQPVQRHKQDLLDILKKDFPDIDFANMPFFNQQTQTTLPSTGTTVQQANPNEQISYIEMWVQLASHKHAPIHKFLAETVKGTKYEQMSQQEFPNLPKQQQINIAIAFAIEDRAMALNAAKKPQKIIDKFKQYVKSLGEKIAKALGINPDINLFETTSDEMLDIVAQELLAGQPLSDINNAQYENINLNTPAISILGGVLDRNSKGLDELTAKITNKKYTDIISFLKDIFTVNGKAPTLTKLNYDRKNKIGAMLKQAEATAYAWKDKFNKWKEGKTDQEVKNAIRAAMEFLTTGDGISSVPTPLQNTVIKMKNEIKGLSRLLQQSGFIDPNSSMYATIAKNMGVYLNRSYASFIDPQWNKTMFGKDRGAEMQRRYEEAFKYVQHQLNNIVYVDGKRYEVNIDQQGVVTSIQKSNGQLVDPMLDEKLWNDVMTEWANKPKATQSEIEQRLREIAHIDEGDFKGNRKQGKMGKTDLSMFEHKKDIPKVLRDFLGEYNTPETAYINSVMKMAQFLENQKFLHTIQDMGMNKVFFDKPTGEYNKEFSNQPEYSPLSGLYTSPEIMNLLEQSVGNQDMALNIAKKLNAIMKVGATIYSPKSQIRNFLSNFFIDLANGSLTWGNVADKKASLKAFVLAAKEFKGKGGNILSDLANMGVIDSSAVGNDLQGLVKDLFNDSGFIDALEKGNQTPQEVIYKFLPKYGKKIANFATNAYMYGDNVHKIFNYYSTLSQVEYMFPELSKSEQKQEAARRFQATNVLYDKSPKIVSLIRSTPLLGAFPSFPAQIFRIAWNIPKLAMSDLQEGFKNSNNKQIAVGLHNLSSYSAVVAATIAMQSVFSSLIGGGDEDDQEALRMSAPDYAKNNPKIITKKDGTSIQFIDIGWLNPFSIFQEAYNAFKNTPKSRKGIKSAEVQALWSLFEPFLSADMSVTAAMELANNETGNGFPIYNEEDNDKALDIAAWLGGKMTPSALKDLQKLYYGATAHEEFGRTYDLITEITSLLTGTKVYNVDTEKKLYGIAKKYKDIFDKDKDIYSTTAAKYGKDSEEAKTAYDKANEIYKERQEELIKYINYLRSQGVSDLAIGKRLGGVFTEWYDKPSIDRSKNKKSEKLNRNPERPTTVDMWLKGRTVNLYKK